MKPLRIISIFIISVLVFNTGYGQDFSVLDLSAAFKEGVNQYAISAGATKASVRSDDYSMTTASFYDNGNGGYNVRIWMPWFKLSGFEFNLNGERGIGTFEEGGSYI